MFLICQVRCYVPIILHFLISRPVNCFSLPYSMSQILVSTNTSETYLLASSGVWPKGITSTRCEKWEKREVWLFIFSIASLPPSSLLPGSALPWLWQQLPSCWAAHSASSPWVLVILSPPLFLQAQRSYWLSLFLVPGCLINPRFPLP